MIFIVVGPTHFLMYFVPSVFFVNSSLRIFLFEMPHHGLQPSETVCSLSVSARGSTDGRRAEGAGYAEGTESTLVEGQLAAG